MVLPILLAIGRVLLIPLIWIGRVVAVVVRGIGSLFSKTATKGAASVETTAVEGAAINATTSTAKVSGGLNASKLGKLADLKNKLAGKIPKLAMLNFGMSKSKMNPEEPKEEKTQEESESEEIQDLEEKTPDEAEESTPRERFRRSLPRLVDRPIRTPRPRGESILQKVIRYFGSGTLGNRIFKFSFIGVALILLLFIAMPEVLLMGLGESFQLQGGFIGVASSALGFVVSAPVRVWDAGVEIMQRRIAIATGESGVYVGRVDSNMNLGVSLEFSRNTQNIFHNSDLISLIALIGGRQLDPVACEGIGIDCDVDRDITLSCTTDKGELANVGIGFGGGEEQKKVAISFDALRFGDAAISCNYGIPQERGGIYQTSQGTRTAFIRAGYSFITGGSYEVPGVWAEQFLTLPENTKQNYQLQNAWSTPGPIKVEFELYNSPLLIAESGAFTNSREFGFRITNSGRGIIENIEELHIQLPKSSNYYMECSRPTLICNERTCSFAPQALEFIQNIQPGKSIDVSCRVLLDESMLDARRPEYTPLLFNVIVQTRYLETATQQLLIKPDQETTFLTENQCDTPCPTFQCRCPSTCPAGTGFIQRGQTCGIVEPETESEGVIA